MASSTTNYLDKSSTIKNEKGDESMSTLVAMFLFSLILLAAYLMVMRYNASTVQTTSFFTEISKSKNQRFQIGDMKIGTSLKSLKKANPSSVVGVSANGQISAHYSDGSATYTAWYGEEGPRSFSYMIKYDNVFQNTDEEAIVYELSEKYGAPSANSCNARITDGVRACKFTWWLKDGVRFDAITRRPIKTGDWLNLTIVATDTRLKNRAQRGVEGTLIKGGFR
ncbi:MAG: hypothetical protein OEL50_03720 [Rhodospirillaceae bacterium]|nr:hypothetical protein [Rhodospirillaceae bacterium]